MPEYSQGTWELRGGIFFKRGEGRVGRGRMLSVRGGDEGAERTDPGKFSSFIR